MPGFFSFCLDSLPANLPFVLPDLATAAWVLTCTCVSPAPPPAPAVWFTPFLLRFMPAVLRSACLPFRLPFSCAVLPRACRLLPAFCLLHLRSAGWITWTPAVFLYTCGCGSAAVLDIVGFCRRLVFLPACRYYCRFSATVSCRPRLHTCTAV